MFCELYFMLFNRVTDAIRALEGGQPASARQILIRAQQDCEERYLEQSAPDEAAASSTPQSP